jgi:hypothetical protein
VSKTEDLKNGKNTGNHIFGKNPSTVAKGGRNTFPPLHPWQRYLDCHDHMVAMLTGCSEG